MQTAPHLGQVKVLLKHGVNTVTAIRHGVFATLQGLSYLRASVAVDAHHPADKIKLRE
jgi:hypothetical protein